MKIPFLFILKRTAIDGKEWFCVCRKSDEGELRVVSKHKRKKDAQFFIEHPERISLF